MSLATFLKHYKDEQGKIWIALNARHHKDLINGLKSRGIKIENNRETRFQLTINKNGKLCEIKIPTTTYLSQDSEDGAKMILDMIPIQAKKSLVKLHGSDMSKDIGSKIVRFTGMIASNWINLKNKNVVNYGTDTNEELWVEVTTNLSTYNLLTSFK